MKLIQENIQKFLSANKIATICFVDEENNPYCINCLYTFDAINNLLIAKSSNGTKHQNYTKTAVCVSGTILPNTIDILKLKGIQFVGKIISEEEI